MAGLKLENKKYVYFLTNELRMSTELLEAMIWMISLTMWADVIWESTEPIKYLQLHFVVTADPK